MFGLSVGFTLLLWVLAIIGWVANIVQVIHLSTAAITGVFILKCIGIFVAPLGVILGWIGLF